MAIFLWRNSYIIQRDGEWDPDEDEEAFWGHVKSNLLDEDDRQDHLPVPVYLYIKPKTGVQFLLHIMLYRGLFATEIDITNNTAVRKSLR